MSKSYLTVYEMMHIPCPTDPSSHTDAELGNCALNVDGKCIFGGQSIGGKCYTGLLSLGGSYQDPANPGATSGPHKVFYTDNQRGSARGGQGAYNNAHGHKAARSSWL